MKLDQPWMHQLGGFVAAGLLKGWMSTLESRVAYYDVRVDAAHPACTGRNIYLLWHEYIPFPVTQRSGISVTMLVSQHRDAQILVQTAKHFRVGAVAGSTTRGGTAAIMQLLSIGQEQHLVITPDGPRGPRRKLAIGAIYLAAKMGLPLVCMGVGYDRPWRLKSWDRFAIPKPLSRARCVVSPPLHVPNELDRAGLEEHRQWVETVLNQVTTTAEDWATSGAPMEHEFPVIRGRLPQRAIACPPAACLADSDPAAAHKAAATQREVEPACNVRLHRAA